MNSLVSILWIFSSSQRERDPATVPWMYLKWAFRRNQVASCPGTPLPSLMACSYSPLFIPFNSYSSRLHLGIVPLRQLATPDPSPCHAVMWPFTQHPLRVLHVSYSDSESRQGFSTLKKLSLYYASLRSNTSSAGNKNEEFSVWSFLTK